MSVAAYAGNFSKPFYSYKLKTHIWEGVDFEETKKYGPIISFLLAKLAMDPEIFEFIMKQGTSDSVKQIVNSKKVYVPVL